MINCEIIRDLLPLYKDEVVSTSSIALIEDHLKICDSCKRALAEMADEVEVKCTATQQAEISAFRLLKKKILKKNVVVACTAIVLGMAILCGLYICFDRAEIIIPYEDVQFTDVRVDNQMQTIDIAAKVRPAGISATSIAIKENDETVRLVFITYTERVISKWAKKDVDGVEFSFRAIQPDTPPEEDPELDPSDLLIYEPFDRCEIYYVSELGINAEADYQRLRTEGRLIWNGVFEN